jgi:hypothetical protein
MGWLIAPSGGFTPSITGGRLALAELCANKQQHGGFVSCRLTWKPLTNTLAALCKSTELFLEAPCSTQGNSSQGANSLLRRSLSHTMSDRFIM